MFLQRSSIGDSGTRRSTTRALWIAAFFTLILSFWSIDGIGEIVGSPQFSTISTSQLGGLATPNNGSAAGGHSHHADANQCSHHTTCASFWVFPTNTDVASRVSSKRFDAPDLLAMRDRLDALDTPPPKYT